MLYMSLALLLLVSMNFVRLSQQRKALTTLSQGLSNLSQQYNKLCDVTGQMLGSMNGLAKTQKLMNDTLTVQLDLIRSKDQQMQALAAEHHRELVSEKDRATQVLMELIENHQTQVTDLMNRVQSQSWQQYAMASHLGKEVVRSDPWADVPDDQWADHEQRLIEEADNEQLVDLLRGVSD